MAVDSGHFPPPRTEDAVTEIAKKLKIPMKTASYSDEFLKAIGDRKFRNPETGNDVVFNSLPHGEQQKVFKQWSAQKSEKPAKEKSKKKPTFEAARKEVFSALKGDGWTLKEGLKTPQATKRVGDETVILHFKPQALWVETKSKRSSSAPRSMWVDIRDVAHDSEKWAKEELPKLVKHFADVKMASTSMSAAKWEGMPKGWTDESRKKFWNSLTSGAPKHKVSQCIKKMDGKVTNAGAFCASLADRVIGKEWRSEPRKKKAELLIALQRIASELDQPLRTRRDYGAAPGSSETPDLLAKRADSEWIDQREMDRICPPCAQRMRRAGLAKVKVSVVRKLIATGVIARR
jgi:hypothetical protein